MHYECIPHTLVLAQIPSFIASFAQIYDVVRTLLSAHSLDFIASFAHDV
jgi:hypothetical protein